MGDKNKLLLKNKSKKIYFIIVLILLVGTLLRVYNLSSESLTFDEADTLMIKEHPNSDYGNPPFYYSFLDFWTKLFGDSEFSIRFPSVIFGLLSILVLYYLTSSLFNKRIALLSALILAVNPFHIYLSQQARMYSLFTLFSLLSLFYFFKILKEDRKTNMILYLVFNILKLYTYYFAIFVLLVECLYFTLFHKDFKSKSKDFMLTNLFIFILFSPQFIKIYNGFLGKTSELNWGLRPSEYFISIFNSFLGWDIVFTAIVFLLFLFGLLRIKNIDKKLNLFGIFYVLLPLVIGFFLSFKIVIIPRYFIFILPIYIMFISKGLINIKYRWIKLFLILGIVFISGFRLADDYSKLNNPQWREVVDYIENNSQKEDVMLFDDFTIEPFEYYYKGNLTRIGLLPSVNVTENEIFYNNIKPKLKADRVWLILSDDFRTNKYYTYKLERDFRLISSKWFVKVRVHLYENE